jgi:hypothetical protein
LIHAAERALELLSPVPIQPEPAQFINTAATLALCRGHSESARLPGLKLMPWLRSMERLAASGATHSLGFPMTAFDECNRRGQRYQGPKALIVDGLCYSAADMFAAGFKDHAIGPVVGVHKTTGAGGANVWSHRLLQFLSVEEPDHGGFRLLPDGADMRAAVRRTLRVGPTAGELVEDFGIEPDILYSMTRRDVLGDNADLIEAVTGVLAQSARHNVSALRSRGGLRVESPGSDFALATVCGRPVGTLALDEAGKGLLNLPIPGVRTGDVEIVAYADGRAVARTRVVV